MKKALFVSVVFASVGWGCHQNEQSTHQDKSVKKASQVVDPKLQQWVGHYQGVLPCAACISHCPDCDGMGVDLIIHPDQSFKLTRTSYSEHNKPEILTGTFMFSDAGKLKIQLKNVKERNTLILGNGYTEIIDIQSGASYPAYQDFQLHKIA
ncbi:MAG: copper resistance protein NlpE N-terminal domain-containing protein [Acinetobacter sp.]